MHMDNIMNSIVCIPLVSRSRNGYIHIREYTIYLQNYQPVCIPEEYVGGQMILCILSRVVCILLARVCILEYDS